jgi:hypothetical protein
LYSRLPPIPLRSKPLAGSDYQSPIAEHRLILLATRSDRCRTTPRQQRFRAAGIMKSVSVRIAALAFATLVGGCAPDAWKPAPGYDAFLELIGQKCYSDTIGRVFVRDLAVGNVSASFLDATSRLYYGRMDGVAYRQFVTAFSDNSSATNKAIDCILNHLPSARPQSPGGAPGVTPRDAVPPPSSRASSATLEVMSDFGLRHDAGPGSCACAATRSGCRW